MTLEVVILAAGQGSRMKSSLPKVLHRLAGKPLVQHVIESAQQLNAGQIHLVIGHGAEQVKDYFQGHSLNYALQAEQLGTGHAVAQALPRVADDAVVLVLYGDVPLTRTETLAALVAQVNDSQMALLTVNLPDPTGYGRIIRDATNRVAAIVEHKDATDQQRLISEVNTGILAVSAAKLKEWLPQLKNENSQGEYYLTDIIAMAVSQGMQVAVTQPETVEETQGVNNRLQLAELECWHQHRLANELMLSGVTLADPYRIDIRGELEVGQDSILDVNLVFEGRVKLGDRVFIEPNCIIKNSVIGDGVLIKANSLIENAEIAADCVVGPYARLRPGARLAEKAKVGNFVEIKQALIGPGSKVNHLSYVGDAELGADVNVGAGTITCNYDGANKYKTQIEDRVFVGSNSALVAPVTLHQGATIAAGSIITKDVSPDSLAVARGRQTEIKAWQRPVKKQN